MKNLSIKKFSILGLVLIAASAVTAAVLPKVKSDAQSGPAGVLLDGATNSALTCVTQLGGDECTATVGSSTTVNGVTTAHSGGAGASETATNGNTTSDL